jgi:GNAT superfamily N-acetyltransferase
VADESDCIAWAAIKNEVDPADPVAPDELSRMIERDPEGAWHLAWVDGGAAGCSVTRRSNSAGLAFAMVRVLPGRRGLGVGSALYAVVSAHAHRLGLDAIRTRAVADDEATLRFLAHRGFAEIGRECEVRLDLAGSRDRGVAGPPEGVEIVTLGSCLDLAPEAYALAAETADEIAGAEEYVVPPLPEWRHENIDDALPDGSFLALARGRVVGFAGLNPRGAESGVAEHMLTAVTRGWRRRGVALALKSAQIAWARAHGYRELVTYNNEANDPMRALNAQLGYEPRPVQILFRGPLAPA